VNATTPRRNDPCPCGSGRRYKHCHGAAAAGEEAAARALELRQQGLFAESLKALDEAAASDPRDARVANLQGLLRMELRDFTGARESLERAIALSPDFADAHFNLGLLLLNLRDYPNGWREYAWRTRRPGYGDYANYPFGIPRWRGEAVAGKRLLVHAEQGLGDTIQCARFIASLARDGAQVDFFCQPPLVSLMQRVPGVSKAIGTLAERPTHDFHAPIIDVAAHYLPTVEAPHWNGPCITPLPERLSQWRSFCGTAKGPLVGFAWKGSPKFVNDRMRSLTVEEALALTRGAPQATFVSLQAGEPPPAGSGWLDAGSRLRDWDDTAALIAMLDLVIGVDTAVVHVAGAMERPVWTLRAFSPEWRWPAGVEETPWYPSMRLLWQERPGDWSGVIREAARRLSSPASSSFSPAP
jgi:hypothetical protein